VELMGGSIWIDSELGKGSVFSFTVLLERGKEERRGLPGSRLNWGNVRMLAVDDMPEIREYFGDIARRLDVKCDVAAGGEEALALIDSGRHYDIYFVDWKMPGMDGIELSRRIKEYGGEPVVIMISSTEWSFIEAEAKGAGVDRFLAKPLFPSMIADCISECLGAEGLLAAAEASEASGGPGEADHFEDYRIILAEDVEINREIVSALLEPTGINIECAENGVEALRLFSENPRRYDLILMDVQMPEMDGYEATRRIRALDDPKAKQVPIVAMTANVFREDIEKCLASGMNDHLGKPMDLDDVLRKLRQYLG
jgi:CheY-like chemotaxis protein